MKRSITLFSVFQIAAWGLFFSQNVSEEHSSSELTQAETAVVSLKTNDAYAGAEPLSSSPDAAVISKRNREWNICFF